MSKALPYTPQEMQGRFIACFLLISGPVPVLDAVRYAIGPNEGLPVLYNQIASAEDDKFFDDEYDHVIPASEYFERVATNNFKF